MTTGSLQMNCHPKSKE